MTIHAVLFDLDNTLTHRDNSVVAYSQYLAQFYQDHLQAVNILEIQNIIRRIDRGGYPLKEHLTHSSIAASVAYALLQELTWTQSVDFDELTQFWFQHFGTCAVAMSGAEQLLSQLKQKGYLLAVVSNGGHQTRLKILDGLGFNSYFDVIVSSELAGISKPNVEIFRYTCQRLGLEAKQCLFVGDHPINDIAGATQAGMSAVWLQGFHALQDSVAIPNTIQHLHELQQYL